MRVGLIACAMAVALVAAATGAAAAMAAEPVTFASGGEALEPGAPIKAVSVNALITDESGKYECETVEFIGELTENPGASVDIQETSFVTFGKPGCARFPKIQQTFDLEFTSAISFARPEENEQEIRGLASAIAKWRGCEYEFEFAPWPMSFYGITMQSAESLLIQELVPPTGPLCKAFLFQASFSLSSEGEPVTVG